MVKFHFEYADGDPRGFMQRRVLPWLSEPGASLDNLMDWLQGYDLPAADEEAFAAVLRGLPIGGQGHDAKEALVERVVRLLRGEPDVHRPGKRPEALLYNLLALAAALRCPARLGEPLFDMFERRRASGKWNGLDVRDALRSALAANQRDDRYSRIWATMLRRGTHAFLPGGPYDGFTGMLMMPAPGKPPGNPAMDEIGWALRMTAEYVDGRYSSERRPRFRSLLARVHNEYPPEEAWHRDFIHLANKHDWPKWAVTSLPSLCVYLGGSRSACRFLLWRMIPRNGATVEQQLCDGDVLLCTVPLDAAESLLDVAQVLEAMRASFTDPSDRFLEHAVAELLRSRWDIAAPSAQSVGTLLREMYAVD